MKKIFICSPLKGCRCHDIKKHLAIARIICKAVVSDIVIPVAPHLYLPQFLDDSEPLEREKGCVFSLALLRECDGMIVYAGCCGVSKGMFSEIAEAEKLGIWIYYLLGLEVDELGEMMEFLRGLKLA